MIEASPLVPEEEDDLAARWLDESGLAAVPAGWGPPVDDSERDDVTSRLRSVPPGMEEASEYCPRCRRRTNPVGRIGLRLVFEHCGVHFFRPPRRHARASVRFERIAVAQLMRSPLR